MRRSIDLNHRAALDGVALRGAGFAAAVVASPARRALRQPLRTVPARRPSTLGGIVIALIRTAATVVRRALKRYRQHRIASAAADELRQLDDRALHDLGLDRSEITSVAAELAGETSAPAYVRYAADAHAAGAKACRRAAGPAAGFGHASTNSRSGI